MKNNKQLQFSVQDIPFDNPTTQIVDGYQSGNDIYILSLICQGDYIAKNGKGIANEAIPKIMPRFSGITHTASLNLRDHPEFMPLPEHLIKNATAEYEAEHYRKQARNNSIGKYVHFFYTTAENGIHRVWGIFKISDPHYAQAWKNKEFPKYTSSTFLPLKFSEKNPSLATDVIPVDNCSVDNPAYNFEMVKIHKECNSKEEGKCIHDLTQSGKMLVMNSHGNIVNNCTMMALGKFNNYFEKQSDNSFSSNLVIKFSEINMVEHDAESKGNTNNNEKEQSSLKPQEEQTLIEEKTENYTSNKDKTSNDNRKSDFETLYNQSIKEIEKLKTSLKEKDSTIQQMQPRLEQVDKLIKENNVSKITEALGKVPQEVLSGEQRDKELEELVKAVNETKPEDENRMTLNQAMKYISKLEQYTAPVAKKMKSLVTNSQKGLREEPLISNSYPLQDSDNSHDKNKSGKEDPIDFSLL